mmetsp:Transcript_11737/g.19133  ORF Transcript_11737/g.19133 Transcript_11737/m.19133 type:complete len:293 (-) Transcript_11737:680-1558(-)
MLLIKPFGDVLDISGLALVPSDKRLFPPLTVALVRLGVPRFIQHSLSCSMFAMSIKRCTKMSGTLSAGSDAINLPRRCESALRTHLEGSVAKSFESCTSSLARVSSSSCSATSANESAHALRTPQTGSPARRINAGRSLSLQFLATQNILSILKATARLTLYSSSSESEIISGITNCWHKSGPNRFASPFNNPAAVILNAVFSSSSSSECASSRTILNTCSIRSSSFIYVATCIRFTLADSRTTGVRSITSRRNTGKSTRIITLYASVEVWSAQNSHSEPNSEARFSLIIDS